MSDDLTTNDLTGPFRAEYFLEIFSQSAISVLTA